MAEQLTDAVDSGDLARVRRLVEHGDTRGNQRTKDAHVQRREIRAHSATRTENGRRLWRPRRGREPTRICNPDRERRRRTEEVLSSPSFILPSSTRPPPFLCC